MSGLGQLALRLVFTLSVILYFGMARELVAQVSSAKSDPERAVRLQEFQLLEKQARSDYTKGDYVSAAKKYEALVSLEPRSANTLNDLGICYHFQGRLQEAVQTLQKALELNPDMLSANLILGIDNVRLNNPEEAIPFLQKALQIDPSNRDAMFGLASAHMARQEYDLATGVYKSELDLRPEDADAWYALGLCFERMAENTTRQMTDVANDSPYTQRIIGEYLTEQDDSVDAEQALLRALASAKDQYGLHASLGFAHLRSGDLWGANEEFETERNLHLGNLDAKLGLAELAIEKNDFAQAKPLLCEVYHTDQAYFDSRLDFVLASLNTQAQSKIVDELSIEPVAPGCIGLVEEIQRAINSVQSPGRFKQTLGSVVVSTSPQSGDRSLIVAARAQFEGGHYSECFDTMRESTETNYDAKLLMASCACLSGHFFAGFEVARSVVKHDPQNTQALYWEAETARSLAHRALLQSVSLAPESWQGHILLGDIFRQRKQWDRAVLHYEDAARLKPSSPAPFLGLGTVYWQMGQNEQAEAALLQALKVQPDNNLAEFELGDIYVREHRFEEATALLERTVAHAPDRLPAHVDLGNAYASLGRKKEAILELQRAVAIDRFGDINYHLYRLCKEQGQVRLADQYLAESKRLRAVELQRHQQRTERFMEIQRQSSEDEVKSQRSVH